MRFSTKQLIKFLEYTALVGTGVAIALTQTLKIPLTLLALHSALNLLSRYLLENSSLQRDQSHQAFQATIEANTKDLIQHIDKISSAVHSNSDNLTHHIEKIAELNKIKFESATSNKNQEILDLIAKVKDLTSKNNRSIKELRESVNSINYQYPDQLIGKLSTAISKIDQAPGYWNIIKNRSESRECLLKALREADSKIILVCPWLSDALDQEITEYLDIALKKGIKINIGFGHLDDINYLGREQNKLTFNTDKYSKSDISNQNWKYTGIESINKLENRYPNLFKAKVLGTHEKYLVCDDKFAMVGSHNFLTSKPQNSKTSKEIGIYTSNKGIIDELICHFSDAADRYPRKPVKKKPMLKKKNNAPQASKQQSIQPFSPL